MNLLDSTIIKQDFTTAIKGWVDSTTVPSAIDSVTYNLYESNNPFRKKFNNEEINNNKIRVIANTGTAVGAEIFSAFANPYYLTHKITQMPVYYQSAVNAYKRNFYNNN